MRDWAGFFRDCGGRESGERGIKVHGESCSLEVKLRCDPQSLPRGNMSCLWMSSQQHFCGPRVHSPGETFSDVNWEGQPTQQGPALCTQAATQWHLPSRDLENGNIRMKLLPQGPSYLALLIGFFSSNKEEIFLFCFPSFRIRWCKVNYFFLLNYKLPTLLESC